MNDLMNLEKLVELRDSGKISTEEFELQKKNLFDKALKESGARANPKNGIVYILLAWFVGTLGIHNFYAGYILRGAIQLLLTLTAQLFLYIPLIITAAWAYLELMVQNKSRNGARFSGRRGIIRGLRIAATIWLAFALYSASYVEIDIPVASLFEGEVPAEMMP